MKDLENIFDFECSDYTILIVDDELSNLKVMESYLETYGFEIMVARSGDSALEKAKKGAPNLILLDIMMPGMDGFETCTYLKSDEVLASIPVIFLSALTDIEDKVKGFAAGAVDFISKPAQEEEVLVRVGTHLKLRHLQQQLEEKNNRLDSALGTGNVVNVAIGILMERHKLEREEVFAILRKRARSERRKLKVVAEEILDSLRLINLSYEDRLNLYQKSSDEK